jgi:hypothetical protein
MSGTVRLTSTIDMRTKLLADLALIERALAGERLPSTDRVEVRAFCAGIAKLLDPGVGGAAGGTTVTYQLAMAIPLKLLDGEEYDLAALEGPQIAASE